MLTANEIERFSIAFDAPMRNLENRIMEDIIRRIKINGEITRAADWQINRLYELGMSKKDIENAIKQSLDLSDEDIHKMYSEVLKTDYLRNAELYKATGKNQIPLAENFALQRMLNAVSDQTYGTLKNITNSLGFSVRNSAGRLEFKPIADYYQQTLDSAIFDIASGVFDYNTVLKRAVSEMTNSGLRTVDYASGWANRVDVAARRAIMTGMSQLTAKVNENNAKALDTEYFEVSWHGGARPEHQEWQGKVYSRKELEKVCGLGTVTGLCGANCYHDYYPFIPGISERTYTDEQLAEMNREENTPVEYNGRKYTKYEALQRQRRLETAMRAQKQKINLLETGGANEDDVINARCRYHGLSQEYSMFSKAMNLPQQRERVNTGGAFVAKVGAKRNGKVSDEERLELLKNPLTSKTDSDIIKEKSKKPITKITDNAIEKVPKVKIDGYSDEQCEIIQQEHKKLLDYSRANNDNKEVAFVFNGDLTERREFLGEDDRLDFGSVLYGKDLFVMHNHPRNSSYSMNDILCVLDTDNIKSLSIVKNNGSVETLTKTNNFRKDELIIDLKRQYKKIVKTGSDEEIDKAINKFLERNKEGLEWIKSQ